MHETTDEVRRDIEETRARITATLQGLDAEVESRKSAVTDRVEAVRDRVVAVKTGAQSSITDFAREHPWYALGAALGIGLVIGRSGADEAAARKTAEAAKRAAGAASGAAASAAQSGMERAKGLFHRDGAEGGASAEPGPPPEVVAHDPQHGAIGSSTEDIGQADGSAGGGGIVYKLQTGIVEAIGGDVLLEDMRREAATFARQLQG